MGDRRTGSGGARRGHLRGRGRRGTPVVEAARRVAAAGPGQILATAVVPMVAGGRAGARFTDLGPMELKGLAAPVAVCELQV